MSKYQQIATEIASLVERKQTSYGDAFGQAHLELAILFPNGIPVERYTDVLTITRIVDKLFRIANNKELFAEDPWADICGYALLCLGRRAGQETPSEDATAAEVAAANMEAASLERARLKGLEALAAFVNAGN